VFSLIIVRMKVVKGERVISRGARRIFAIDNKFVKKFGAHA